MTRPFRRFFRLDARPAGARRDIESEIDDELRFHLEMRAESLERRGIEPAEAREEALRQFGSVPHVTAVCRAIDEERERTMRWTDVLETIVQDVTFAARSLRRTPGFTAAATITLMLGIGATSAVFSAVNAVLLRPLPYEDAGRIITLGERSETNATGQTTSWANASDWRTMSRSLEALAIFQDWSPTLSGGCAQGACEPERITAAMVTPDIFRVLRVRPSLGRGFLPDDGLEGSRSVVVLSHAVWRDRFGGDPDIIGRAISLNRTPFEVVGVMPQGFVPPVARLRGSVWANLTPDDRDTRTSRYLSVIARVRDDRTVAEAVAELGTVMARLVAEYPKDNDGQLIRVTVLRDELTAGMREPLLLLLGGAGLVLLIACANISNLLLARGVTRAREFAVRTALGAGRGRAIRQLLTESVVLAVVGGVAGLVLAVWVMKLLAAAGPDVVRESGVRLDWVVVAFTAGITVTTVLVFGLLPALRATRVDLQTSLREGGRGTTGGGARLRRALVVTQLATALTLLVGAGLLLKSFSRLLRVDAGLVADGVLTAALSLPARPYDDTTQQRVFYDAVEERLATIPGVRAAGLVSTLPFGGMDRIGYEVEGQALARPGDMPDADRYIVTPGYFSAMGITLLQGRVIAADDRSRHSPVVVVDELLARRHWPGQSALGKRLKLGSFDSLATVVGVVRHVKQYGFEETPFGQIYIPLAQRPWRWMTIVARRTDDPAELAPAIRRAVLAIDPNQPVYDVQPMTELLATSVREKRFTMTLLGAFALVAIALAAIGLYGVIAYGVSRRRQELGIRLALGATPAAVVRLVVREGLGLAIAGIVIGLLVAANGARVLTTLLYEVEASDPAVLTTVPALLFVVALVAAWLPARRAALVDPAEVLRND